MGSFAESRRFVVVDLVEEIDREIEVANHCKTESRDRNVSPVAGSGGATGGAKCRPGGEAGPVL